MMDRIGANASLWKTDVWKSAPLTPTVLVHTKLVELGVWLGREAEGACGCSQIPPCGRQGGTDTRIHSRTKVTTSICIAADSFIDF